MTSATCPRALVNVARHECVSRQRRSMDEADATLCIGPKCPRHMMHRPPPSMTIDTTPNKYDRTPPPGAHVTRSGRVYMGREEIAPCPECRGWMAKSSRHCGECERVKNFRIRMTAKRDRLEVPNGPHSH